MRHTLLNKLAFGSMLAVVMFTALAFGAVHQSMLALTYVLITVAFLFWIADALRSGEVKLTVNLLQLPLLGAAMYAFIQVIPFGSYPELGGVPNVPRTISIDPFATQLSALHFVALLIFFSLMLSLLDSASRIRKASLLLCIFGFIYAFYSILQSVLDPRVIYGFYEPAGAAPFGSFVNRNNFAGWMELAAAIPLGLLFAGAVAKDKRLIYLTGAGLMGVAVIASGSRGGLVALVAEIVFLLLLTMPARVGKKGILLKLALAAGLLISVVAGSIFVGGESALTRLAEESTASGTNQNRLHIWDVTLKVIGESMPLGVGFGAYPAAYTKFDANSGFERVEQAHNDYLQVLADAGIVGAVLGIAFLILLFRTGFRVVKTSDLYRRGLACGAFAGIFGVLIHSIFDFLLHTTAISILFLTLLAILVASDDRSEERNALRRR